jgi:hypothetical protein
VLMLRKTGKQYVKKSAEKNILKYSGNREK